MANDKEIFKMVEETLTKDEAYKKITNESAILFRKIIGFLPADGIEILYAYESKASEGSTYALDKAIEILNSSYV